MVLPLSRSHIFCQASLIKADSTASWAGSKECAGGQGAAEWASRAALALIEA